MIEIEDVTKVYQMGEIEIMDIFRSLHDQGMTIVMVTHDPDIAAQCERVVRIKHGLIASDELNKPGIPVEMPAYAEVVR